MSTLEGLIQSVSATITSDIVQPLFGNKITMEKTYITINKISIILLAVITFFVALEQIISPKLSVAILAQNGVYAYFSAAFIPVIFGIFLKRTGIRAPLWATITAIAVHFGIYYFLPWLVNDFGWNFGWFTTYLKGTVRNPAIAASSAILVSSVVGLLIYFSGSKQKANI